MIQELEIERNMISVMLENESVQAKYCKKLREDDFTLDIHKDIFRTMQESQNKLVSLDMVSALSIFGKDITKFMINGLANPEKWYQILRAINIRNRIINCSEENKQSASQKETNPEKLLEEISLQNIEIRKLINDVEVKTNLDAIKEMEASMKRAKDSKTGILGIDLFGIYKLDKNINGGEPGNMIVIAGRPGMGKSLIASSIMCHGVKNGYRFVLWSLEMTKGEYMMRMVAGLSKNKYSELRQGNIEDPKTYNQATSMIFESKIAIIDKTGLNIDQMYNYLLTMHEENPIDAVLIDHMGLIVGTGKSLYENTTINSMAIKRMAKSLDVPVIALSQLSRSVEQRSSKIPMLSDLRESGSIEQDADKIIFPYRPGYYDIMDDQDQMIIAKNRGGELKSIVCEFDFNSMLLKDADIEDFKGLDDPIKPYDKEVIPF